MGRKGGQAAVAWSYCRSQLSASAASITTLSPWTSGASRLALLVSPGTLLPQILASFVHGARTMTAIFQQITPNTFTGLCTSLEMLVVQLHKWRSMEIVKHFFKGFSNVSSGGSRIFPRGVRQLPKLLLFFEFLLKTAWKWKNLDPQGGARVPGAPP